MANNDINDRGLKTALEQAGKLVGVRINNVALAALAQEHGALEKVAWSTFFQSLSELGFAKPRFLAGPDDGQLPVLVYSQQWGWGIITAKSHDDGWTIRTFSDSAKGSNIYVNDFQDIDLIKLESAKAYEKKRAKVADVIKLIFKEQYGLLFEAIVATVIINMLALGTSMFSMQVYDRVIPGRGYETLIVLSAGVFIAIFFDFILKLARSKLMETSSFNIDNHLSRTIFQRLLSLRIDQLPPSVGSLSSQLRAYETIRSFLSSSTLYFFVDVPFSLFFIFIIAIVGHPILAVIPLVFLLTSVSMGLFFRTKINQTAKDSAVDSNRKMGVLVESVEGVETIKSNGSSWRQLMKWTDVASKVIKNDVKIKGLNEWVSFIAQFSQQSSYVGLVATGAYLVTQGQMTMGSLIACSILSGRILTPVAGISGVLVQWAHAKAAWDGLDNIWKLETDNHDQDRPVIPDEIKGNFRFKDVKFAFPEAPPAISVPALSITAGEKVGVIGPVGAGKSTLLRLLAGLYRPSEGRVLLDGLDIHHISRELVSEKIGYVQQDTTLFSGTLRENLIIGIADPGDEVILAAAEKTGLIQVIANHHKGLDLLITEGGKGLSGGQRQLVAVTRLLVSDPTIWLMDEPTASMDERLEAQCFRAIRASMDDAHTMVVVTHKPSILSMVDRLIVVSTHGVVMDGPKDEVLQQIQNQNKIKTVKRPPQTATSPDQQNTQEGVA
jgi:ATP-binding cassette, subfamily C, bacterial LapB